MQTKQELQQLIDAFRRDAAALREEIAKVIVGADAVVDGVVASVLVGSHALLEGVPGLGKTLLVRAAAAAVGLKFSRIQFTPDLMPADVIGTNVIESSSAGGHSIEFRPGPIFAGVVLADEINRATPKTQSALLEAMQERRVTVGGKTYEIAAPYIVLATQNPLEMEGTYPLPEAQLDRFLLKLLVSPPDRAALHKILDRTLGQEQQLASKVLDAARLLEMQDLLRQVPVPRPVQDWVVRLVEASHPGTATAPPLVSRYLRAGSSPRGAQALLQVARVRALLAGRLTPSLEDIEALAADALRHRLLLSFEAEAEGVTSDAIIATLLAEVPQIAE
jgi:MoxR-like ATPase